MSATFVLGQVVITANAKDRLHPEDIPLALSRHSAGDWGEVNEEDRMRNNLSVHAGLRLMSVYRDRTDVKFWIITKPIAPPQPFSCPKTTDPPCFSLLNPFFNLKGVSR